MANQQTLKTSIHVTGVGAHSGKKIFVTLRPAPANTGIVFRRIDLENPVCIPARCENVSSTDMCTTIAKDGVYVSTIEHLMSAFVAMGIDNAFVDVSTPEVPIMDGSAAPFIFLIESAGAEKQQAMRSFVRIKKEVKVEEGDRWASLKPYNGFKVGFQLAYAHPAFNDENQFCEIDFSSASFTREIARARTFGFLSDYEYLTQNNLALGASLDNTVALDEYKVVNESGLRYSDECVRHKILDVVGDMYLLGAPLVGAFCGYKSGHSLNRKLLEALLAQPESYEVVEAIKIGDGLIDFSWAEDMA